MWSAYHNPKAMYNLKYTCNSTSNLFNPAGDKLEKSIDDYLESKRLAFPRFFFMSNAQFLQFLTLSHSHSNINSLINVIFSGA